MGLDSLVNEKSEKSENSTKTKTSKTRKTKRRKKRDNYQNADITELSMSELDFNKQAHVDELTRRIKNDRFLKEYDDKTGEYRGPTPPSIFETNKLPDEDDEEWYDEWVDLTGEWENAGKIISTVSTELVKAECPCGNEVKMSERARYIRCSNCSRVLINRMWEDDRVKNPNRESKTGLRDFM